MKLTLLLLILCNYVVNLQAMELNTMKQTNFETATFGAGCFWCVEAVFQNLTGVESVTSGYMGGKIKNPSYKEVCMGTTGHAEVVQIIFNSKIISYQELLEVFWKTHDPTTINQQGNDVGDQYRSVVYYHNETQEKLASYYKQKLNKENAFEKPVITAITAASIFYKAEDYHQEYFNLNKEQPYCKFVIQPKIEKMEKIFKAKLK